jgi:1,4-dihydroxy-2-naphthoate octaprenyltransferase
MIKGSLPEFLHLAGSRYWTASLLPALVGTTLPFWLRPPGFSFRLLSGLAFLFAAVLCQAGLALLQARLHENARTRWSKSRILGSAGACILIACLLGLNIHSSLRLNGSVYEYIFLVYGLCVLFVGVLYVLPPLHFFRRMGGEIVLAYSLGLLPVLGAYLVQAGDLIRTVYLASLPVVGVTALWVWIEELGSMAEDKKRGRVTLVMLFGVRFSGRYILLALVMSYIATLFVAVFSASLSPLTLVGLLCVGLLWRIVRVSWNEYASPERMLDLRKYAFALHLATCSIISASSLAAAFI